MFLMDAQETSAPCGPKDLRVAKPAHRRTEPGSGLGNEDIVRMRVPHSTSTDGGVRLRCNPRDNTKARRAKRKGVLDIPDEGVHTDDTPADAVCADYIFRAHAAPPSEISSTKAEARDVERMRSDGRAPTSHASSSPRAPPKRLHPRRRIRPDQRRQAIQLRFPLLHALPLGDFRFGFPLADALPLLVAALRFVSGFGSETPMATLSSSAHPRARTARRRRGWAFQTTASSSAHPIERPAMLGTSAARTCVQSQFVLTGREQRGEEQGVVPLLPHNPQRLHAQRAQRPRQHRGEALPRLLLRAQARRGRFRIQRGRRDVLDEYVAALTLDIV
ncbi:hypothetical protein C8F04DRAFT_1335100 [Mycena alexandri]|uniref:Uncharacterized protein n=1 Tax=Mycena alexandri TaxID=1745969 RepID=A0AAD6THR4_9AGAR|nr:hypothetical protein C8F04DRAFT_1335100 [Mycena alexandri]